MLFHSSCVVCTRKNVPGIKEEGRLLSILYELYILWCTLYSIDKLYTEIGKVFLPWELNLLLPCFGLLALSRHCSRTYTETVDPACRPSIPEQWSWHGAVRECMTGVRLVQLDWRRVGYLPFPILLLYIIYLCCTVQCTYLLGFVYSPPNIDTGFSGPILWLNLKNNVVLLRN